MQKSFHDDIGPFAKKYKTLVAEISQLYGEAKEKHAQGIKLLIKDFAYHPAFKRWDDHFWSVGYRFHSLQRMCQTREHRVKKQQM